MKNEKEVKARLKEAKKRLKEVTKRFEKHDNHDDLDQMQLDREEVRTLEWVLSSGPVESECKDGIGGY